MVWGNAGRSLLWFVLGLVLAGAAFLHFRSRDADNAVTIRSYEVKPEIAGEMRNALAAALWRAAEAGGSVGEVTVAPNGRLLVRAPESVQHGVASVLRDVGSRPIEPTPAIHIDVWLVGAASESSSESPGLAEIEPALAAIRKSAGEMRFRLLEKLSTTARSGNVDSEIDGVRGNVRVTPTLRRNSKGEPVVAMELKVRLNPLQPRPGELMMGNMGLKSLAELRPGELLVVGQSNSPRDDSQIYYIVRATL